jgi:transcriptional regulator GlxA family with amidase domain
MRIEIELPAVGKDFGPVISRLVAGKRMARGGSRKFLSLQEAASMVGLTPRPFQRLFKKVFGRTFKSAQTYFAMKAAAAMLCSPQRPSVKEVWVALGYSDPISFGRAFRKIWKTSPTDYAGRRPKKSAAS